MSFWQSLLYIGIPGAVLGGFIFGAVQALIKGDDDK